MDFDPRLRQKQNRDKPSFVDTVKLSYTIVRRQESLRPKMMGKRS